MMLTQDSLNNTYPKNSVEDVYPRQPGQMLTQDSLNNAYSKTT